MSPRRRDLLATLAVALSVPALAPAPAAAGRDTVTITVTAHLRSDYRFGIDHTDTSDPECVTTTRGTSRVITDITTVRPATYRITKLGRRGHQVVKRLGGAQEDTRGIDMKLAQTRSTSGSTLSCFGETPFPADGCGTRSWDVAVTPGLPIRERDRIYLSIEELFDSADEVVAHDRYLNSGCGIDTSNASEFITVTRNLTTGRVKLPYFARLAHSRLFAARPRRLTVRGSATFDSGGRTSGDPGGGWTERRSVELRIRKR